MPRIRTIKPEYWTDGDMLRVSRDARLFYIGLWNFADDNGVIEGDPMSLKARVFPCDDIDVKKLLDELTSSKKLFIFCNGDNKPWIWIKSFGNHQLIDRERKSNNPFPTLEQRQSAGFQEKSLEIISIREGKGREVREGNTQSPFSFDAIWNDYPNKLGKKQAEIHFNATVKTAEDYELIKKALYNYCHSDVVKNPKYIQHGSTWFNNWADWITKEPLLVDSLSKWEKKPRER